MEDVKLIEVAIFLTSRTIGEHKPFIRRESMTRFEVVHLKIRAAKNHQGHHLGCCYCAARNNVIDNIENIFGLGHCDLSNKARVPKWLFHRKNKGIICPSMQAFPRTGSQPGSLLTAIFWRCFCCVGARRLKLRHFVTVFSKDNWAGVTAFSLLAHHLKSLKNKGFRAGFIHFSGE